MKKAISIILILVMLVPSVFLIACSKDEEDTNEEASLSSGNFILSEHSETDIALLSESIEKEYFSDYGVSPTAEAAYTVTAVVLPADANQNVSWNLTWKNPSSSWANGKNVEDYIDIALSDDTKTATISCKQSFGEQIKVTVVSVVNNSAKANLTLDYAQKVTDMALNIGNVVVNLGDVTPITYELNSASTGMGGLVSANATMNNVYTLKEDLTYDVQLVYYKNSDGNPTSLKLSGYLPSGTYLSNATGVNQYGREIYYDYEHDIKNWLIIKRTGDVSFDELSKEELIQYFSDITEPDMYEVQLTVKGKYNTYTYTSKITCTGYTNTVPVSQVSVDNSELIY